MARKKASRNMRKS